MDQDHEPIMSLNDRPPPLKLREAFAAVTKLIADPEDTKQVFVILQALRGRSDVRTLRRFAATPTGIRILAEQRSLLAALLNRRRLAALPEGTVGHSYDRFMGAELLSAEPERLYPVSSSAALFRDRLRDMHDLVHVVTGYGRDPLGELCVLAFTFAQTDYLGLALICVMGAMKLDLGIPKRRVWAAIWEGFRAGRRGEWLPAVLWEDVLEQPLFTLRAELKIEPPRAYPALPSAAISPLSREQVAAG
jgi:ubiquinone biosynthesis protein COQ4